MMTAIEESVIPVGNCIQIVESVFEPDPHAGRVYKPNNRTLCSIFPEALAHPMLHAGGRKMYNFPAVPKGSYALLRVYDTWTLTRNLVELSAAGEEALEGDGMQRSPVHCQGVAEDLIRQWAQDAPGNASGAKPGVMILAGDTPAQLELDGLNEMQTVYFRWLVMKADEFWITGARGYITDDHRRALRWLGSEDREWFKKIAAITLKRCPACAEEINAMATVCRHCSTNLIKYYSDIQFEPDANTDPGVAAFLVAKKSREVTAQASEKSGIIHAGSLEASDDERRAAVKRAATLGREADMRAEQAAKQAKGQ